MRSIYVADLAFLVNRHCQFRSGIDSQWPVNGPMQPHQVRELRVAAGMTQVQLAEAVGLHPTAITKLESGKKLLRVDEMQRIMRAVGDDAVRKVLGSAAVERDIDTASGFAEDLTPYEAKPGDPFAGLQSEHRYLFRVHCNALDGLGIQAGDVVVIDDSAAACTAVAPLQIVHAIHHVEAGDENGRSILRQYVPPSLLITNSLASNLVAINMRTADVHIVGVIVSFHRALHN